MRHAPGEGAEFDAAAKSGDVERRAATRKGAERAGGIAGADGEDLGKRGRVADGATRVACARNEVHAPGRAQVDDLVFEFAELAGRGGVQTGERQVDDLR